MGSPPMTRPRILLADDHRMVAQGLQSLLSESFELVGTAADGREMALDVELEDLPPVRALG